MIDPEHVGFLESGCALIVGTVHPDGRPHACRGWGLDVLGGEPTRARLLVSEVEQDVLAWLEAGGPVAVTACDVRSLRSLQMKGRALGVGAATGADRDRAERYLDEFFTDIHETEGTPWAILERIVPAGYAIVSLELHELYDQTPGPSAGTPLAGSGP